MPGELGTISGLGRSPGGGGHSNTLQHSCLEKPQEQRSTASYSSWVSQRVRRAERLSKAKGFSDYKVQTSYHG